MSKDSTQVGPAVFAYIAQHTIQEDAHLRDLRAAALKAGLPEIHIAPEQAAFLHILLRAARVRHVVEVGTLGGYSAIAMARALPPRGKVTTLELSDKHAQFAREWIAKSDVKNKVDVVVGDARTTLPTLPAQSADAVFLDADKAGYVAYLAEAMRILRPGGILLADNVLAHGAVVDPKSKDETGVAIRAFNEAVQKTEGLRAVIVPLGDGCLVAVKS
jgi:predicted O-methyltransferase YrrM